MLSRLARCRANVEFPAKNKNHFCRDRIQLYAVRLPTPTEGAWPSCQQSTFGFAD